MHWLPSYPLKDCGCGKANANQEQYQICTLLRPLLNQLVEKFGIIPVLPDEIHSVDYIMNRLPRSEFGLSLGKWEKTRPTLIHVLRKIDRLSHPDKQFDEDEPNPEDALNQPSPQHPHSTENL